MGLEKRRIARLDVKGTKIIKGVRFEGLRVVGNALDAASSYYEQGIDEIIYIDSVASLYGRNSLDDLLRKAVCRVFVPITAGGGVRKLEDAGRLLSAGADKVAINSHALRNPDLISEISEKFGKQCVVVSVQARRFGDNCWMAMGESGREKSLFEVRDWMRKAEDLGAGEILLTSVDQDGTLSGPDEGLLDATCGCVGIPLIYGGGIGQYSEAERVLTRQSIAAISIGSALHKNKLEIRKLKSIGEAQSLGSECRGEESESSLVIENSRIDRRSVGVIDYGLGNQQSLVNALKEIGADVMLSSDIEELRQCDLLTLPGVGAFPEGMKQLKDRGLDSRIIQWVAGGKPLMGICLGMQMLFERGEEYGLTEGLGIIAGEVSLMSESNLDGTPAVLPHVGWNRVYDEGFLNKERPECIGAHYFVHSFVATALDSDTKKMTFEYGGRHYVAGIRKGNVVGFQFHPERSGKAGLKLLRRVVSELTGKE